MKLVFLTALLASQFAPATVQRPGDAEITQWVKEALSEDRRVSNADISVNTVEGIVTLTGAADDLMQQRFSELEADKIRGVLGVVNRITVKPAPRPDAEIRQAIRRRIINSSVISSESIGVKVVDGVVLLSGSVPSLSEKEEASLLSGEVSGVASIDNKITVSPLFSRPDGEIAADVRAQIDRDVYLVGMPITVAVTKGAVKLSGDVGNAYEKDRAADDAREVANVKEVENGLKVKWWELGIVRTKPAPAGDSALAAAVSAELYVDLRIAKPWEIRVKAKSGHVVIRGMLPTVRQRYLAQQDAKKVPGVAWVSDLIAVKGQKRDDLGIFEDADFALKSDFTLARADVRAFVNNGVVTLTGNVGAAYEKSQAEKNVSGVIGVSDIVNDISVNPEPRYLNGALRERIMDRLGANWQTWAVAGRITVTVRAGFASLTGQVDSWAQYEEAARVASFTEGIRGVDNRLTVKGVNYPWEEFRVSPPDALSDTGDTRHR